MSDTILTQTAQAPHERPDFDQVSDAMLYDIARHTASVLSSMLLNLKNDAADDGERDHWAARRRLVKQQVQALDADDRAGLIAQDEVWRLEKLALTSTQ